MNVFDAIKDSIYFRSWRIQRKNFLSSQYWTGIDTVNLCSSDVVRSMACSPAIKIHCIQNIVTIASMGAFVDLIADSI
jgi:hypothetical protein